MNYKLCNINIYFINITNLNTKKLQTVYSIRQFDIWCFAIKFNELMFYVYDIRRHYKWKITNLQEHGWPADQPAYMYRKSIHWQSSMYCWKYTNSTKDARIREGGRNEILLSSYLQLRTCRVWITQDVTYWRELVVPILVPRDTFLIFQVGSAGSWARSWDRLCDLNNPRDSYISDPKTIPMYLKTQLDIILYTNQNYIHTYVHNKNNI